ncbi:hypothetical protein ACFPYI_09105 [Halomarina salina]|uniref:DUF106 domain-containing protein n=1 Tax=Halomarina salina TaxID=1872699 RepID=A0ABD5RLH1_9EURY|nr:hypothetical protein [Halomarina salina]
MAPLGFYGSLATAGGVFLGLLSAYLTSRIAGMQSERDSIRRRVEAVDARRRSLREQRELIRDEIEGIEEKWAREERESKAKRDIKEFIDDHAGEDWSPAPKDVEFTDVLDEVASFVNVPRDALPAEHIDEASERFGDILYVLEKAQIPYARPDPLALMGDIATATNADSSNRWAVQERERYDAQRSRLVEVSTEMSALQRERESLSDRFENTDPEQLRSNLKDVGLAAIASVIFPLVVAGMHVSGLVVPGIPFATTIEPLVVFAIWVVGLGVVFAHMNSELTDNDDSLPDESAAVENDSETDDPPAEAEAVEATESEAAD